MQDRITELFTQECTRRYVPLGFRRSGRSWTRLIHDVWQVFTLRHLDSSLLCTITFGIFPLCAPFLSAEDSSYTVEQLDAVLVQTGQPPHPTTYQNPQERLTQLLKIVNRKLLPLFDRADSCQSALGELIALDRLFERRLRQISGSTELNREIIYYAPEKYYMALKVGDTVFASRYQQFQITRYSQFLSEQRSAYEEQLYGGRLKELRQHRDMLRKGNTAFFAALCQENERRNIEEFSLRATQKPPA